VAYSQSQVFRSLPERITAMSETNDINQYLRDRLHHLQAEEPLPEGLHRLLTLVADHVEAFPPIRDEPVKVSNFVYFH